MNHIWQRIAVIVLAVGQWVSAVFALSGSFNTAGAAESTNYFVPTAGTFIIWGFIFTGSLVYAIYQALPSERGRPIHQRIGGLVALNSLLCIVWNSVATLAGQAGRPGFQPVLVAVTAIIIIGMMLSMARVFIILRNTYTELLVRDQWFAVLPHTIYFTWLTVGTIANITTALVALGWNGEPYGAVWSAVMIAVAVILTGVLLQYARSSMAVFGLTAVILWALYGIYEGNGPRSTLVAAASLVGIAIVLILSGVQWFSARRQSTGWTKA